VPENAIPYKNLIPFEEIIAAAKGVASGSVAVAKEYHAAVGAFGTEFEILLRASKEDLCRRLPRKIADGVMHVREGKVSIKAGYDGEYGIISIFPEPGVEDTHEQQLSLF
jgi:PHP family Zn ribbon phosphoesterase